jgi:Sec-independent protein secretion pathway component TatC
MRRIRPISHEDRLSVVAHRDELRSRIIVSLAAVLVAFGLTMWQNHLVLKVLNRPLPTNCTRAPSASPSPSLRR